MSNTNNEVTKRNKLIDIESMMKDKAFFGKYTYVIDFKKDKKQIRDFTADAYALLINPFIVSNKIVDIKFTPMEANGNTVINHVMVLRELVLTDGTVWHGVGDCDDTEFEASLMVRIADTRAFKRACSVALGISKVDCNIESSYSPIDECSGTPLQNPQPNRNERKSTQVIPPANNTKTGVNNKVNNKKIDF